jgi:integrase/recombinase XerD
LVAIHSFHAPPKRFDRNIVTYLTEPEIDALLQAPDQHTWLGRRDRTMLAVALQTGLRASELTALAISDVHLGTGAHISCHGKGRKQRITPLTSATVTMLTAWLVERAGMPADPLFPTSRGLRLSRDALQRRVAKHARTAAQTCPTLASKKIYVHADLALKERALNRTTPTTATPGRYQPTDTILAFLNSL